MTSSLPSKTAELKRVVSQPRLWIQLEEEKNAIVGQVWTLDPAWHTTPQSRMEQMGLKRDGRPLYC